MSKLVIMIIILSLSLPCYAEIELKQLYGLRNKENLQGFIQKVEHDKKGDLSDVKKLKMLGIAYHNLAVLKVKGASQKAAAYLQKAHSLLPADDEVKAYLGSATTMVGRDSWNVFAKISIVNQGIKMMDEAVAEAPDNIVVRMVRANNSLELPEFLKRKNMAKKDFQYLKMLITKPSTDVEPDIRAEVFYQLGMFSKGEGSISGK